MLPALDAWGLALLAGNSACLHLILQSFGAAIDHDVRFVGVRIQSRWGHLLFKFDTKSFAAELLHRPVVHHFHVLPLWLNRGWAVFKLLEVKRRHLLNVNERLVV